MKGNYGIRLAAYTVLAFLLAYFGSTTLLFLVLGVVLLAEKNEWAVRQVLQALVLCYVGVLVRNILGIFDFLYDIVIIGTAWGVIAGFINTVVELIVLVFAVVGIIKNLKDQDAELPLVKSVADWVYGVVKEKAAPAPAATPAPTAAPAPAVEEAPKAEETAEQAQE